VPQFSGRGAPHPSHPQAQLHPRSLPQGRHEQQHRAPAAAAPSPSGPRDAGPGVGGTAAAAGGRGSSAHGAWAQGVQVICVSHHAAFQRACDGLIKVRAASCPQGVPAVPAETAAVTASVVVSVHRLPRRNAPAGCSRAESAVVSEQGGGAQTCPPTPPSLPSSSPPGQVFAQWTGPLFSTHVHLLLMCPQVFTQQGGCTQVVADSAAATGAAPPPQSGSSSASKGKRKAAGEAAAGQGAAGAGVGAGAGARAAKPQHRAPRAGVRGRRGG